MAARLGRAAVLARPRGGPVRALAGVERRACPQRLSAAWRATTAARGFSSEPQPVRVVVEPGAGGGIRARRRDKEGADGGAAPKATLLDELPGMPQLKPAGDLPPPKTEVTTLSNGLRVASEETYGQVASLAAFVDSGSRYESSAENGASHFLETLAFKTTPSRSVERISDEIDGKTVFAGAGRDSIMYRVECLREQLDESVDMLADTMMHPLFTDEEMEEARRTIEFQVADIAGSPDNAMQDAIIAAAFGESSPLGQPLVCPDHQIHSISADTLRKFMGRTFSAERTVLAGAGVEHGRLVEFAEKHFGGMQRSGSEPVVASDDVYVGGDRRQTLDNALPGASPYVHVAVCMPCKGWSDEDIVPICVLDSLMGGGSSFSAGGPGKGMYSRLYLEVLNRFGWVEAASAFSLHFNDSGLTGLYGQALPQDAGNLANVLVAHMRMAAERRVTEAELSRARNQLHGAVMLNLERRGVLCEDIGRQILSLGEREDPALLCERIQAVTADDLARVASRVFSHPPSVAVVGPDVGHVPAYDDFVAFFQQGPGAV